jgi:hypothetical protein
MNLDIPVSAPIKDIVDWGHPLIRKYKDGRSREEALLAAWRAEQGYRWFFDRADLDMLVRRVDRATIDEGLQLGKTFLSSSPELPTTASRMRALRLDRATRISKMPNAVSIDWHHYTPEDDAEWMYKVNRQRYLPIMALAARREARSDITERVFEIMDHWIANCPCPKDQITEKRSRWGKHYKSVWQMLNTGLRLQFWMHALHILWDSQGLTAERFARYMRSLRQHALVSGRTSPCMDPAAKGNHLIMAWRPRD